MCIQAYDELKKQVLEAKSATSSTTSSTPEPSCASGSEANTAELLEDNSKTSEDSVLTKTSEVVAEKKILPKKRGRKRKGVLTAAPTKNPRKSPRQHASTLAILSSLIHQRKRREMNKSKSLERSSKRLSDIPEVEYDSKNLTQRTNPDLVSKTLDEMFSESSCLEEVEIAIPMDDSRVINVSYNADAIQALEDFESQKHPLKLSSGTRVSPKLGKNQTPKRRPGRKKKKNRTGWPKRNRRLILKKDSLKDSVDECANAQSASAECDDKLLKTEINSDHASSINENDNENRECDQSSLDSHVNRCDANSVQTEHKNLSDKEDRVNSKEPTAPEIRAGNCKSDLLDNCEDDLENWDKVLSAKLTNTDTVASDYQPFVKIQKITEVSLKQGNRRLRSSSSSPRRTNVKRPRRMPASPKSPRILRKPRGRWYRER